MPPMTPVSSSHVAAIGYEAGELHVEYQNGKTSVYGDEGYPVSEDVYNAVLNAASVGQALHQIVKTQGYPHRYQ
jgi:KTSC domain-containing protein